MSKNYTISHSKTTGWWHWACKDGSAEGWEPTKKDAKTAANGAGCPLANFTPPTYDAEFMGGIMQNFVAADLDDTDHTFENTEISENAFTFFFGLDCDDSLATETQKAIAILKIWNVYNGGTTRSQIESNHNLSSTQFDNLIVKDYIGVTLSISDLNEYTWVWPS